MRHGFEPANKTSICVISANVVYFGQPKNFDRKKLNSTGWTKHSKATGSATAPTEDFKGETVSETDLEVHESSFLTTVMNLGISSPPQVSGRIMVVGPR